MRKIWIYITCTIAGAFFGFGVGWLTISIIATAVHLLNPITGNIIGDAIYPMLLLLPAGCLVGIVLGAKLAKKMVSFGKPLYFMSHPRDRVKALAFMASGLIGIAWLIIKIVTQENIL